MSPSDPAASFLLKAGDAIGPYRVVRPLGAGGMGEVYLVEHSHLRKRYALKILPPDISGDANFIDRFRMEARVMADLEHPGIVRVHNFGEDQGRHFLVMDYVEGPDGSPRTLEDELSWGNKLPEHVVLAVALQLCDALEYAHSFSQSAVIHRDLKPGNVLLFKPGHKTGATGAKPVAAPPSDLRVKIADFGLAKIVGADYIRAVIDRSTTLTAVKARPPKTEELATMVESAAGSSVPLLGTYDYMSPEQKTGGAVDARSDLYALGLILYRMLTGHRPEGTYEPPSKSGCRRRWDPVIARCLKRDPEARYQDAGQLKRDLQALGAPVHQRRMFRGVAAGVGVLLGIAALYGAFLRPERVTEEDVIMPSAGSDGQSLIEFRVVVQPTGATLRIVQRKELIAETELRRAQGSKVRLKPGVYTFELNLPGYRPVSQEVSVGPEHSDNWTVSMIEAFGYLHVQQPDSDRVDILDAAGGKVSLEPPRRQGALWVHKLPIGRYKVVVTRADHEPFTYEANIRENAPQDLKAVLKPLPGSLMITGDSSIEIWNRGTRLGQAGEWIRKVPAGIHKLQIIRAGYRNDELTVEVPPNREVTHPAPALEIQAATLTVSLDVRHGSKIAPEHLPRKGRLQVGEREERDVEFPCAVELNEMGKPLPLHLSVPGYNVSPPDAVRLSDREHRRVSARLSPRPVQVTLYSDVPADIFRFRGGQPAKGLRRMARGRDVPLGRTGEPLSLDAFERHQLTVLADGYLPAEVEVQSTDPGSTLDPIHVRLEREPIAEPAVNR